MKPGAVPPSMTDPKLLAADDSWTHTCKRCHAYIQGGPPGLDAHWATVHPEAVSSG